MYCLYTPLLIVSLRQNLLPKIPQKRELTQTFFYHYFFNIPANFPVEKAICKL